MTGYILFTRWPSTQRDSELLRRRIAPALRLLALRKAMAEQLARVA